MAQGKSTTANRPHAFGTSAAWINNVNCWHLDCWLYVTVGGVLYLRAITSRAGRELIGEQWFALVRDDTFGVFARVPATAPSDTCVSVVLGDATSRRMLGDMAGDVFWRLIAPLANLWPRGQYKRRSIAFHMVKPLYVADPCEGIANLYGETGRAARDAAQSAKLRNRSIAG